MDVAHYDRIRPIAVGSSAMPPSGTRYLPAAFSFPTTFRDNLAFFHFVGATGARSGVIETANKFVGIVIKA